MLIWKDEFSTSDSPSSVVKTSGTRQNDIHNLILLKLTSPPQFYLVNLMIQWNVQQQWITEVKNSEFKNERL